MTGCVNEETLQAYFDGELAADAALAVLTHLNGCMTCAGFAREFEGAVALINSAFDDELPDNVPTTRLHARLENAPATTPAPKMASVVSFSFGRHLRTLATARWQNGELSFLRLAMAVTGVIVAAILAGGLAGKFWPSTTTETKKNMVQQSDTPVPALTPPPQHRTQEQRPASLDDGRRKKFKRAHRTDQIARRIKPESIEQATTISIIRHTRPPGNTTLRNPETSEHFRQTQLLLRSFRNTSIAEGEGSFDLAYEKQLSRELLSKNRLFRRSAESKRDSRAEELLSHIEPLLLDIANLPDQPSQAEVRSIKELIREQKIIATLQIYTARVGY
jgi:Putative zinc-finger